MQSDGKVLLQFTPTTALPGCQSKSPVNLPTSVTLTSAGSPRFPSPQVITLPTKSQTPNTIITKPITKAGPAMQRVYPQTELQSIPGKPGEPVKLQGGQTQISFQVPVSWSTQGSGKSLLDASKVSLVSFNSNPTNARSLLQTNVADGTMDAPKVNFVTATTACQKTFITGNKVIGNLAASGQVITQSPTGVISVTRPTAVNIAPTIGQRAQNKGNSFIISNKQYTIVPSSSSQVVTQLVKTDTKNKSNVTMAPTQIMLPSSTLKKTWQQATSGVQDDKQIMISSRPLMKQGTVTQGKTILTHKPAFSDSSKTAINLGTSLIHTAKVVEVGSPNKFSTKSSVLPAQMNWELVKQANQLLPPKQRTSPTSTQQEPPKDNNRIKTEKSEASGKDSIKTDNVKTDSVKSVNNETKISNTTSSEDKEKKKDNKIKEDGSKKGEAESETKVKTEAKSETDTEQDENNEEGTFSIVEVKMDLDDVDGAKVNPKAGTTEPDDFDPVDAMNWKNGVGELPGSSLKVTKESNIFSQVYCTAQSKCTCFLLS